MKKDLKRPVTRETQVRRLRWKYGLPKHAARLVADLHYRDDRSNYYGDDRSNSVELLDHWIACRGYRFGYSDEVIE